MFEELAKKNAGGPSSKAPPPKKSVADLP